jgi:hypothetical protein
VAVETEGCPRVSTISRFDGNQQPHAVCADT